MASSAPSSDVGSSPRPATAALTTELYAFDTLLLTFLGRKAVLPTEPVPSSPTIAPAVSASTISLSDPISSLPPAQTNPQEQEHQPIDTTEYTEAASDAHAAADAAQKDLLRTTSSTTSPVYPNLIENTLNTLSFSPPAPSSPSSPSPPTNIILNSINNNNGNANTDNNTGSNPSLPSWIELLAPSSTATSPSGSGRTTDTNTDIAHINSSDDFVEGKPTMAHNGTGEQGGGASVGGGGVKVRGGITLAYQACQMLPEPIHLRHVNTTLLPFSTPIINDTGDGDSRSSVQDSYAIEYFADQGCNEFLMATAGTGVNVWQAELDMVESNSEKDTAAKRTREDHDTTDAGEGTRRFHRRRLREEKFIRIGKRQLLPSPATLPTPAVTTTTAMFKPWTPAPTTKHALKSLDMVVSVRWVGILKPSEFKMSKALLASRPPNPNRIVIDPLLERRDDDDGSGDIDDEDNEDGEDEQGYSSNTEPHTTESITGRDGKKEEYEQGAVGSNTPPSSPPSSTPTLGPLQDGKNLSEANATGVGIGGFVSWTPFNETQLLAPARRDVGSFPLEDMVFNLAHRGALNPFDGKRNSTNSSTGAGTGGGHGGMTHMTSQIVMAGLIAGLLLILGSLLTAVYYRQKRKKWYEEDGDV
ncbi:hypothetical protein EC991_004748 [Linnemannia zychae]|nr:hypothetical protein EC991_004748 [Linnemannia zychae]